MNPTTRPPGWLLRTVGIAEQNPYYEALLPLNVALCKSKWPTSFITAYASNPSFNNNMTCPLL